MRRAERRRSGRGSTLEKEAAMTGNEGGGDNRARAGRVAALVVSMAGGEEAVRPRDRARIEGVCKQVLDKGEIDENLALVEVLRAIRVRPELAGVGRTIEAERRSGDGLTKIVLEEEHPAADADPPHGLEDDLVVLNVGGIDDSRQIRAVAEASRGEANAPGAGRIVSVGTEDLSPGMRAELMAALGSASDARGPR